MNSTTEGQPPGVCGYSMLLGRAFNDGALEILNMSNANV